MNARPQLPFTIAGHGGKSGSPSEAKNNLKSNQVARVVDLISEGPIKGVVGGLQGVYFDGTQLERSDGTLNFKDANMQFVHGYPDQPVMKGFEFQQSEQTVSVKLLYDLPIVRTILNTDVDRARLTFSVPALQKANDEGDINGTKVQFRIDVEADGGGYQQIGGTFEINGKTNTRYQQAVLFNLPRKGPWNIKVTRLTKDSGSSKLQNELYWDSYTEITDDKLNYTNSACVGIQIDARQFQSIPKRTYLTDGLLCKIPSNYDPYTATYTGVWDGTFNFDWTNNPAWVFYDLVTNNRYGIGDYISEAMTDKWALYEIAKWCDQLVSDGKGGTRRRYECNIQITDALEAYDRLAQIVSIFRGFAFWNGNQLVAVADMPRDPVMQFTNANVLNGQFTYAGGDGRARHTQAAVGWRDPDFLGEQRVALVENPSQISRLGIQRADIDAVGCTNEAQAIAVGKWQLYTEQYESETVQFSTGLESAWSRPGDVIRIADALVAGERTGGRTVAGSTATVVNTDAPVPPLGGTAAYLSCVMPNGTVETRQVSATADNTITVATAFSAAPAANVNFVLNMVDHIEPTLWRVIGVKQTERDQYEMSGLRHLPGKWDYIEKNIVLTPPDVSGIKLRPDAVTGIEIVEYMVQTGPTSVGSFVTLSWISDAPQFDIGFRREDDNWATRRVNAQAIDIAVTEGPWDFQITPVSSLGLPGPTTPVEYEVIGRNAPPGPPLQFRINVVDAVAMFDWLPATELDVIVGGHYELRFAAAVEGAQWNSAQVVIPSIPGTATSVETGYQPGTWFLRTFDIAGNPSQTYALVIALNPDERYQAFVRICEQPDWAGVHTDTEIKMPEEWLTIASSGEDPDGGPSAGTYQFANIIDAGAPFSVRLSAQILAFNYAIPDDFIDSRMADCDTWEDWDNAGADYSGEVTLMISQTLDDPTAGSPAWSPWKRFITGEHYGRAFRFMAVLTAPSGQNIGVEELCILADLRAKIDEGADVPYPAVDTRVTFRIKFFIPPAVVVTVQNAMENDRVQIIAKTAEYFDIRITGSPDGVTQKTRTFDWHAQGY